MFSIIILYIHFVIYLSLCKDDGEQVLNLEIKAEGSKPKECAAAITLRITKMFYNNSCFFICISHIYHCKILIHRDDSIHSSKT